MLTVRLIGRRRVSTWYTLHVLEPAQFGLPVIPERRGHTRARICVLVLTARTNKSSEFFGWRTLLTDPGRQSPHTALLVVEQLPFWKRLTSPQSRQGLHFCRLRSSLKRLLRQGTHRASSP